MPNLNSAKMKLKNSAGHAGTNRNQEVKDLREAGKCMVRYLEKVEKVNKSK